MSYRIPYPNQLHIEDNQIYDGPEEGRDIEEEKGGQEAKKYSDLDLVNNKALFSDVHMGTQDLLDLNKILLRPKQLKRQSFGYSAIMN